MICCVVADSGTCRVSFHCCVTSTETVRTVRDGDPRISTSSFAQLMSSDIGSFFLFFLLLFSPSWCFTSTQNMGSIRSRPDMTIMVDWALKTDYLSSPSVAVERQLTAGALSLRKKSVRHQHE